MFRNIANVSVIISFSEIFKHYRIQIVQTYKAINKSDACAMELVQIPQFPNFRKL